MRARLGKEAQEEEGRRSQAGRAGRVWSLQRACRVRLCGGARGEPTPSSYPSMAPESGQEQLRGDPPVEHERKIGEKRFMGEGKNKRRESRVTAIVTHAARPTQLAALLQWMSWAATSTRDTRLETWPPMMGAWRGGGRSWLSPRPVLNSSILGVRGSPARLRVPASTSRSLHLNGCGDGAPVHSYRRKRSGCFSLTERHIRRLGRDPHLRPSVCSSTERHPKKQQSQTNSLTYKGAGGFRPPEV